MNKTFVLLFSLSFLLCICSCSSDSESCTFSSGILSGTVLERNYDLREGQARADGSVDEYQVFLFGEDEIVIDDICDLPTLNLKGTQLTFFVGNELEEREFGGTRIVTLYHAETQTIETSVSGCYELTDISSTTISGNLFLQDDSKGLNVSGSWSASICQ